MSHHQVISPNQLNHLLEANGEPRISMHLLMERQGQVTRKNRTELKNALKDAQRLLKERGVDASTGARCLGKVENLLNNEDFWLFQDRSLAIYARPDELSPFLLGVPLDYRVRVSDHFSVLPLVAELERETQSYVLQLSEKMVKLHHWRDGHLQELKVPNLPKNMDDALQLEGENSLQGHTLTSAGEGSQPIEGVHGQGGGKDNQLEYRTEFMQRVNTAVASFLAGGNVPLILATVVENYGLYEKVNTYPGFDPHHLEGNYDRVTRSELEQKIHALMETRHQHQVNKELSNLEQAKNDEKSSTNLKVLVRAAYEGRIKSLFVKWPSDETTGTWDPETFEVTVDERVNPLHDDLVDRVAAETFRQGGVVRTMPARLWERREPCVGEFRW